MIRLNRKLIFALVCLVMLLRSQGSAGLCLHAHDHFASGHHHHQHAADGTVCDCEDHHHDHHDAECCCQDPYGEPDDCEPISVLLETAEDKDPLAAISPDTGINAANLAERALSCTGWLRTTRNPTLFSLRTVILIV